jgi:type I restriction enzyme, R subunit
MAQYNEVEFERELAEYLGDHGWLYSTDDKGYNRVRALFPADVFDWLTETQAGELAKIVKVTELPALQEKARARILDRLVKVLDAPLSKDAGTLSVLRRGFKDVNANFTMCEFKPGDNLNPAVLDRYSKVRLRVMRQVHYSVANAKKSIDLVFFVNGIPVATVELKTSFTQSVHDAVEQYKRDRLPKDPATRKREPLLAFGARALVHFAVDDEEVWMSTHLQGADSFFLPFNKGNDGHKGNPVNPSGPKTAYFWEETLERDTWLNIIGKYMHLSVEKKIDPVTKDETKRESLLFPRYHQLQVVEAMVGSAKVEGPGNRYLAQHSAGSGKTNSIAWTAHRLSTLHHDNGDKVFDSVIVVTDRTVLDSQLSEAIYQIEHKQGMVVPIKDSKNSESKSKQLTKALTQGAPIITVTIQTFPFALDAIRKTKSLSGKSYAIIADEAHSSQSGTSAAKLRAVLTQEELQAVEDGGDVDLEAILAAEITQRAEAKNISYFAFTATPKGKTLELFGRLGEDGKPHAFHTYTMQQAIEEGFILDVLRNYTPYKVAFQLAHNGRTYDSEGPIVDKSDALKSLMRWVQLHPYNIAQKVQIVVEHFRANVEWRLDGHAKAMVVTSSRKEAVRFKLAIDKYIKESKYTDVAAIVAFSGDVADPDSGPNPFNEINMNPGLKGRSIPKAFATDEYQVLLVANKFQTGFDQPLLTAMYVDKKLSGVTAVQTLSRLNRTVPGKQTFILDFVNEPDEILESFKPYYREASMSEVTDPNIVHDLQTKLDAGDVYTEADVDRLAKAWFTQQGHNAIAAAMQPAKSRFNHRYDAAQHADDSKTVAELDMFRKNLTSFVNAYDFLSQIINYADTALEKRSIFYRLLARKIADETRHRDIDLTGVEMTHYSIKDKGKRIIGLGGDDDGELKPMGGAGTATVRDPVMVRLREVLLQMNSLFDGEGLTDGDTLGVYRTVESKILENDDLEKQSKANSRADFYDSTDLWPAVISAILEAGENHTKGVERLLDEGNRAKFLKALQAGGLYEKLRGDLETDLPPTGADESGR